MPDVIVSPGARAKLPPWLRIGIATGGGRGETNALLAELKLNTVCSSARCPNLGECFHRRNATFLILGDACTRNCRFCAVPHAPHPALPDPAEPERIAEAVRRLNLQYVVITCVTRDDLPDGGAGHFVRVIEAIRDAVPAAGIEVLTSDFQGDFTALRTVLAARPNVFNHNIETVERLSAAIRGRAGYRRSLTVLREAARLADGAGPVKSGLMVGLGETDDEVTATLHDLRASGVTLLTIGQYLPPSSSHWPLARYVAPEKFIQWKNLALQLGFRAVAAAPLVRSSYRAGELAATP